ncbi:hypothetical protein [Rubricoccus marinus]|uniref:Uncharacterized protein n=1 Tax=Rubricoccus marinus TaxID=716817 RepID=A0A259TWS4_9BACT|nr:hypothetical protein [Rubricoccus marinus]OZC02203.1 hypothetical protein BSZ36_03895 [Rubricoccus marinus]
MSEHVPQEDRPTEDGISIFSTLEAFKDGLTSTLSRESGVSVARGWIAKIEAEDRPDLKGIRDGLNRLALQLEGQTQDGPASGADIGKTMETLGAHTREAAGTLDAAHLVGPLTRLGDYLKAAGIALQGGSRPDEIEGISTDVDGTIGDPESRSANIAPDLSKGDAPA